MVWLEVVIEWVIEEEIGVFEAGHNLAIKVLMAVSQTDYSFHFPAVTFWASSQLSNAQEEEAIWHTL